MAQLIKLRDYISRYQWNIYRYPSQYIRLKQDNWKKLYELWNSSVPDSNITHSEVEAEETSAFGKWKGFFKRDEIDEEREEINPLPETKTELKQYFLDKLFPVQLKWASSTVTDLSFIDGSYYQNGTLKYFLQRFPDTYLLMYYPIFNVKKAPIDGEIVLISPIGIEIIYLLDENPSATIHVTDERTWNIEFNRTQIKRLSPIIALKRSEQIIRSVLSNAGIDFPIKKVVLSRTNRIIIHSAPYNATIIDKQKYEKWFNAKRSFASPLKGQQLKTAEALLKQCQTTAVKRPEWEDDITGSFSIDNEV